MSENRQKDGRMPLRILGITLARGGSQSVPQKNIRAVLGTPLIAYTIAEAKLSQYLSRYIVSTDSQEIREVALEYGAEVPFLRPKHLASNEASSVAALVHAVDWLEKSEGRRYDYIVELMCTNPMKTANDIDAVIEKLTGTGADSVISVCRVEDHHPARIKKIVNDQIVEFCVPEDPESRRQDLKPDAYVRNGAIYALRRDVLMEQRRRYGTIDSRPYVMPTERSVNVDTLVDLAVSEILLRRYPRPSPQASSQREP